MLHVTCCLGASIWALCQDGTRSKDVIFCELLKNSPDRILFYNMYMHNMFMPTQSHVAALIVKSIYPFPCKHPLSFRNTKSNIWYYPSAYSVHPTGPSSMKEGERKYAVQTNHKLKKTKNRSKTTPYDATFAFYACRKNFIPPHESRCCPFLASLLQTALALDPSTCPPSCIPHFEAAIPGVAALDCFVTSP